MKLSTGAGIGIAFFGILVGAFMEGTSPMSFIDIPAILIIFCGTSGATLASVGPEAMSKITRALQDGLQGKAAGGGRTREPTGVAGRAGPP